MNPQAANTSTIDLGMEQLLTRIGIKDGQLYAAEIAIANLRQVLVQKDAAILEQVGKNNELAARVAALETQGELALKYETELVALRRRCGMPAGIEPGDVDPATIQEFDPCMPGGSSAGCGSAPTPLRKPVRIERGRIVAGGEPLAGEDCEGEKVLPLPPRLCHPTVEAHDGGMR